MNGSELRCVEAAQRRLGFHTPDGFESEKAFVIWSKGGRPRPPLALEDRNVWDGCVEPDAAFPKPRAGKEERKICQGQQRRKEGPTSGGRGPHFGRGRDDGGNGEGLG